MSKHSLDLGKTWSIRQVASLTLADVNKVIKRLCKHFQHKVKVHTNMDVSLIEFGEGMCTMRADNHTLILVCESNEKEDLKAITDTMDRHIYAFCRDEALQLNWQDA